MIRFSAFLVVIAVGLLIAGVVTSKLLLVYVAIGVSGVALLALGVGAAVNWRELTSKPGTAEPAESTTAEATTAEPTTVGPTTVGPTTVGPSLPGPAPVPPEPVPAVPAPAAAPAGAGWPITATSIPSAPSRAGYLPATEPPPRARPPAPPAPADVPRSPAAFTPRRETPAPGAWDWRDDSIPAPPPPAPQKPAAASEPEPSSGADPAAEPELTLVPGTAPAASAPAAAESKPAEPDKPDKRDEQDKQAGEAGSVGPDPSMEVTVVPGVPRYHNASCILIRFMGDSDLDKMTLAAARDIGCTPCRACLPDQPEKSPE